MADNQSRERDERTAPARRVPGGTRQRRRLRPGAYRSAAERRLARFRRGSALAVALTAMLLLIFGVPGGAGEAGAAQATDTAGVAQDTDTTPDPGRAVQEAAGTLRDLAEGASAFLPKLVIAVLVLVVAGLIAALLRPILRRLFRSWSRGAAASAGVGILIWIVAIGAALAVLTGDARTLLGSVGLLGLALSWALQAPIESFSAWVLNSFREYYRVGDRIAVGEVLGDVHRIDFLTTTVWEAGRPDSNGLGGGPTGALVTFPNSEVLRANIVNYTRDFPWVWDEVSVGVANESDLRFAMERARAVADDVLGPNMRSPGEAYRLLLARSGLADDLADVPQVFLSAADAWMNITVRYLVPARQKRATASRLLLALSEDFAHTDHAGRIIGSYPFTRVQMVGDK